MESNKTFRVMVIVTVSTLVTFFTITPVVESKYVPLSGLFFARSLLAEVPSSNPPSEFESPSPAPAPGPEVMTPITSPANSPAEIDIDSPAPSPEAPSDSVSPTNAPAEADIIDSPAASPEAPSDSMSEEDPETPSPNALSGVKLLKSPKNILNSPLLPPEIKTLCGKTDFPALCESSVSPLLTAQPKLDDYSVLILTIQASINATKAALATVEKVGAPDCLEVYDDAVSNLEDAINAVKSRDIHTVNVMLSAAMTNYGTCNDGFEEAEEPNPLADVGDNLTNMVSNSLVISTLIK